MYVILFLSFFYLAANVKGILPENENFVIIHLPSYVVPTP